MREGKTGGGPMARVMEWRNTGTKQAMRRLLMVVMKLLLLLLDLLQCRGLELRLVVRIVMTEVQVMTLVVVLLLVMML
jgi:hypothetical protein